MESNGKGIVEAGKTMGINTEGADSNLVVIRKSSLKEGKKIKKDTRIKAQSVMTQWVEVDGIYQKEVQGDIYLADYIPKGWFKRKPRVEVLSYAKGLPISVSASILVGVVGPNPDSVGETKVKGTIRMDTKFDTSDPKVVDWFFQLCEKEDSGEGDIRYDFVTAKSLSDFLTQQIDDKIRDAISPNPYISLKVGEIENDVVEKLNADPYMRDRGIIFSTAALRVDRTALESIEDKELRGELEIRNKQVDVMVAQMNQKFEAEMKKYSI